MGEFAIRIHATNQRRPRLANRWFKFSLIKQMLIHPPRQTVSEKARTAGFLRRITFRVKQTRAPKSVTLLARQNFVRHVFEQFFKTRAVRMIRWQILQDANDAGENPAVAARPENFLPVRLGFFEISVVAEIKMLVWVVKKIRRAPEIRKHEIQIAFVIRRR